MWLSYQIARGLGREMASANRARNGGPGHKIATANCSPIDECETPS